MLAVGATVEQPGAQPAPGPEPPAPVGDSASIVTTFASASTLDKGRTQLRVATPSMCTVHAPHCATPQPYLVPVSPSCSRITHRSGVSGSASTS